MRGLVLSFTTSELVLASSQHLLDLLASVLQYLLMQSMLYFRVVLFLRQDSHQQTWVLRQLVYNLRPLYVIFLPCFLFLLRTADDQVDCIALEFSELALSVGGRHTWIITLFIGRRHRDSRWFSVFLRLIWSWIWSESRVDSVFLTHDSLGHSNRFDGLLCVDESVLLLGSFCEDLRRGFLSVEGMTMRRCAFDGSVFEITALTVSGFGRIKAIWSEAELKRRLVMWPVFCFLGRRHRKGRVVSAGALERCLCLPIRAKRTIWVHFSSFEDISFRTLASSWHTASRWRSVGFGGGISKHSARHEL